MAIRELCKTQIYLTRQVDRIDVPTLLNLPSGCDKPVLKLFNRNLADNETRQAPANINVEHMNPPFKRVSAAELNRLFNEGRYFERAHAGEFRQRLEKDDHPAPPHSGQKFCTRTQTVSYLDVQGNRIALIHQYKREDGTIGASGRPSPQRLLLDGVVYFI